MHSLLDDNSDDDTLGDLPNKTPRPNRYPQNSSVVNSFSQLLMVCFNRVAIRNSKKNSVKVMLKETPTGITNSFPVSTTPPPPPLSKTRSGRHVAIGRGPSSSAIENNGTVRRKTRSSAALGKLISLQSIKNQNLRICCLTLLSAAPESDAESDGPLTVAATTVAATGAGGAAAVVTSTTAATIPAPEAILAAQPGPAVGGPCINPLNSANNKRRRVSRDSR